MTVEVRFNGSLLAGRMRDGEYGLPEGATVAELMEAAQTEAGHELSQEERKSCVFILDNSPASYSSALRDGGKLRVMYRILGG